MTDEIRFDGRVAVITGAGSGLGRSYALELARRGARVVVNDLGGSAEGRGSSQSAADRTLEEIRKAGGEAVASYDSVATPAGGAAIVQRALDAFGAVDIVINTAGILRDKTFPKLEWADLDAVLDVHLRGAFYVTQPAFRVMKERGYGRILMTASGAGIFGNFGQSNYGAAKMGLVGLANVLAEEGRKYDIRVNVIAPLAQTRLTGELMKNLELDLGPELVMPLACYLVSEACSLTHEIFSVGGGRFARIFIGECEGWYAGRGARPRLEDVRDHLERIRDIRHSFVPDNLGEETAAVMKVLAGS
jgi:NAD(P)-dependent dehydrogenase (short-subunit alcohol dehydrogenase family)